MFLTHFLWKDRQKSNFLLSLGAWIRGSILSLLFLLPGLLMVYVKLVGGGRGTATEIYTKKGFKMLDYEESLKNSIRTLVQEFRIDRIKLLQSSPRHACLRRHYAVLQRIRERARSRLATEHRVEPDTEPRVLLRRLGRQLGRPPVRRHRRRRLRLRVGAAQPGELFILAAMISIT